jgi:hypothetical protein
VLNVCNKAASGPTCDDTSHVGTDKTRLVRECPEPLTGERKDAVRLGTGQDGCRYGGVDVHPDAALAEHRQLDWVHCAPRA